MPEMKPSPLDPATDELWQLVQPAAAVLPQELVLDDAPVVDLDLPKIRQCVADGAQLWYSRHSFPTQDAILPLLVKKGQVAAVQCCLESPNPIDFNHRDWSGHTLLQLIATFPCPAKATAMLEAVVQRWRTHSSDPDVDWGAADPHGRTFLTAAADRQRLSSFWHALQEVPYFTRHHGAPLNLNGTEVEGAEEGSAVDVRNATCRARLAWPDWKGFVQDTGEVSDDVRSAFQQPDGFY